MRVSYWREASCRHSSLGLARSKGALVRETLLKHIRRFARVIEGLPVIGVHHGRFRRSSAHEC